jgi:hypothetical protein
LESSQGVQQDRYWARALRAAEQGEQKLRIVDVRAQEAVPAGWQEVYRILGFQGSLQHLSASHLMTMVPVEREESVVFASGFLEENNFRQRIDDLEKLNARVQVHTAVPEELVKQVALKFRQSGWNTIAVGVPGESKTVYAFKDKATPHAYKAFLGELLHDPLLTVSDQAMSITNAKVTPGGIDLNSDKMSLTVTKDAKGGVKVNFDPVLVERIKQKGIQSIVPVIINITPIVDIRPILGLTSTLSKNTEQIPQSLTL